ncbi:hypothetical protein MLD38_028319 [Melastoma candidum]|uniref:Uncharacterized protein n=1 Tax=Melastoma candidum TaxID=119954 RepID=A0ACB9N6N6_9MYRT|nr:hypothetical protein MLD38_028319 [Melastoma candidum]
MLLQALLLLPLLSLVHYSAASTATATLQPLNQVSSTPSTIPAFPEQSAASASSSCPLTLPLRHFPSSIHPSCSPRSSCCPALATLLFSSYPFLYPSSGNSTMAGSYDMPEVPEDTETCSEDVGKALRAAGFAVSYRNSSCDLVFCYCGIRLHRLSCDMDDGAFHHRVGLLARDCRSPGIAGCSKCLARLYTLGNGGSNNTAATRSTNEEVDRTEKMHDKDCQLMGLAWLLAKNHTAYAKTVTSVFHAMMSAPDGSDPKSCTIGSDGLPLAVESSQVSGSDSSPLPQPTPQSVVVGVGIFLALLSPFHL